MASSVWLRYIAVAVLIGCCTCKVVLITDHRNGMRKKGRQNEGPSKQRQTKVRMSVSPRSRTEMTDLGLIGQATNGQIFGTLLSDTSDGFSAPRQSIENFIDSFSTLFRPLPLQQTIISNTDDNAVSRDDVTFRQGGITPPRPGASNFVSMANAISMRRAPSGERGFSVLSSDLIDDTPVRTTGTLSSRGVSGTLNTLPAMIGFGDTGSAGGVLGQSSSFDDDGNFFGIDQGQGVGGPVTRRGNAADAPVNNQGVRVVTGIASGQSRPSMRIGEDIPSNQVSGFSETDQRDSSSDMQGSSVSFFNARLDGLAGPFSGQNGGVVSEDVSGSIFLQNQDRPIMLSNPGADDTTVGSMRSSLENSFISNLLSRIFSTPSKNNNGSLAIIENALDGIDASERDNGGAQLFTRMTTNNRFTGDAQVATGGQEGTPTGFTEARGVNSDVIDSTDMRELSNQIESRTNFDQDDRRQESEIGGRLINQVARTQSIDDGNNGFGPVEGRVAAAGNQRQASQQPGNAIDNGRRLGSRSRMMSPSKSTSDNSRKTIGRQPKSDSRKIDSTRKPFLSRGPYMVFQTSKSSNAKSDGSGMFGTPGVASTAFTPGSARNPFRRIRPSFSGTANRKRIASSKQIGRPASQTLTSLSASQARTGGSDNNDSFRLASGSNPNFLSSGFPRISQGNAARVSSRASSADVENVLSSTRSGNTRSSALGGGGRPGMPVRVFMILPNSASGSNTGSSGVSTNPSAIGPSRTQPLGQLSRFNSNLNVPFGTPSVSMGSTSNLGGSGLPNRGSIGPNGRRLTTSFGRGGNVGGTGSFSRGFPVGRNGRIGTNFGSNRVTSGRQRGTFQGRMNTSAGRNTAGSTSQASSSRSGIPAKKRTVKNSGTY